MSSLPDLRQALREALVGRVVVVGIGNALREDDGVGSRIARRLAGRPEILRAGVTVIDAEEVPESHLGPVVVARPDVVLLVDAADLGAHPGEVALLDSAALDTRVAATHRTPLGPVARFLESETGATVMLLAIQPLLRGWSDTLSEPVEATVRDLAALLLDTLATPEMSAP